MRGKHRHWRISALGALLCLLAALFAVEAKLAWYNPNGCVRVELSSTKLQAAEASRQIHQALALPAPAPAPPVQLLQSLAFTAFIPTLFLPVHADVPPAPNWSAFSPPHFLRPPPRR